MNPQPTRRPLRRKHPAPLHQVIVVCAALLAAALACSFDELLTDDELATLQAVDTELAGLVTRNAAATETEAAVLATAAARAATDEAILASHTPTRTPIASPTPTVTPVPTHTPTPDLTLTAQAECQTEIIAFAACINGDVLPLIFPDGAPDHRVVNNTDPATLYRSEDILAMLNAPGVTLVHNNYTRPVNCPLTTACVLHLLLIEFDSDEAALAFFERVTQPAGLENEAEVPAPNADDWDASKCATHLRPSSAAGAPPFSVIFCSVSEGKLHWGFNLSAYEDLPEGFVEQDLEAIMAQVHDYLSVWE